MGKTGIGAAKVEKEKREKREKREIKGNLKISDVYWTDDEAFGNDSKIRLLPINIEKSLIIETNIPQKKHEMKVEVQFSVPDSVLGEELIKVVIDNYIGKSSDGKKYRFETKKITQDLIGLV